MLYIIYLNLIPYSGVIIKVLNIKNKNGIFKIMKKGREIIIRYILYHTCITNTLTPNTRTFLTQTSESRRARESRLVSHKHIRIPLVTRTLPRETKARVCALCEPVATRFRLGKGLRNPVERALPSHRKRERRPGPGPPDNRWYRIWAWYAQKFKEKYHNNFNFFSEKSEKNWN